MLPKCEPRSSAQRARRPRRPWGRGGTEGSSPRRRRRGEDTRRCCQDDADVQQLHPPGGPAIATVSRLHRAGPSTAFRPTPNTNTGWAARRAASANPSCSGEARWLIKEATTNTAAAGTTPVTTSQRPALTSWERRRRSGVGTAPAGQKQAHPEGDGVGESQRSKGDPGHGHVKAHRGGQPRRRAPASCIPEVTAARQERPAMCCMRRTCACAGERIVAAAVVQPKAASSEGEACAANDENGEEHGDAGDHRRAYPEPGGSVDDPGVGAPWAGSRPAPLRGGR